MYLQGTTWKDDCERRVEWLQGFVSEYPSLPNWVFSPSLKCQSLSQISGLEETFYTTEIGHGNIIMLQMLGNRKGTDNKK